MKPCPFCQSTNVAPNSTRPGTLTRPRIYWVNCENCGATGPDKKTLDAAIKSWDTRRIKQEIKDASGQHIGELYV